MLANSCMPMDYLVWHLQSGRDADAASVIAQLKDMPSWNS